MKGRKVAPKLNTNNPYNSLLQILHPRGGTAKNKDELVDNPTYGISNHSIVKLTDKTSVDLVTLLTKQEGGQKFIFNSI